MQLGDDRREGRRERGKDVKRGTAIENGKTFVICRTMDVFGFGMRDADRAIIFANLPLYLRCIAAARATTAADGRVRRSVCDCKGAYGDGGGAAAYYIYAARTTARALATTAFNRAASTCKFFSRRAARRCTACVSIFRTRISKSLELRSSNLSKYHHLRLCPFLRFRVRNISWLLIRVICYRVLIC